MADKTITVGIEIEGDSGAFAPEAKKVKDGLKRIEDQANKTREKMAKLAETGGKFAMLGAAITGPLLLAMNKFREAAKDSGDVVSLRLGKAIDSIDRSWQRIGRVVAEQVTPFLETAAGIVEKIADFAEKNPEAIRAALTIGSTIAALGGLLTVTAQIVSTLATIQGLAAGAGFAGAGATAAGAAGAGAGAAAIGAAVSSALAAALPVVLAGAAAAIGANIGIKIAAALTGRTETEVVTILKEILAIIALGFDYLISFFGGKSTLYEAVAEATGLATNRQINAEYLLRRDEIRAENERQNNWLLWLGPLGMAIQGILTIVQKIADWVGGLTGKAAGGYASYGAYMLGDAPGGGRGGAEFVLSSQATRAAESIIGGRLNQENVVGAMTQNINLANGMTAFQAKRMIQRNNRALVKAIGW